MTYKERKYTGFMKYRELDCAALKLVTMYKYIYKYILTYLYIKLDMYEQPRQLRDEMR